MNDCILKVGGTREECLPRGFVFDVKISRINRKGIDNFDGRVVYYGLNSEGEYACGSECPSLSRYRKP